MDARPISEDQAGTTFAAINAWIGKDDVVVVDAGFPVVYATGWAGKFVPLLGRILSDLALDGKTSFDISHFQEGRTYFHKTEKEHN